MDYELALKLKHNGYEQFPDNMEGDYLDDSSGLGTEQVYLPTLSELIEACGVGVGVFKRSDTKSSAWKKDEDINSSDIDYSDAKTPEEAVAELWLKLQEKN